MAFEGYKYEFRCNALHFFEEGEGALPHQHTFAFILYFQPSSAAFLLYNQVERVINDYLSKYRDQLLNDIPPFDTLPPTIENLGNTIYAELQSLFEEHELSLCGFEISDMPTHSYVVADPFHTVDNITPLMLQAFISNSQQELIASFHSKEEPAVPKQKKKLVLWQPDTPLPDIPNYLYQDQDRRRLLPIKFLLSVLFFIAGAFVLMLYMQEKGYFPSGADIYGHLFKGDLLYHNILEGNYFPLYTKYWYNGVQPFRYWAPLPYYMLAGLQALTGGSPENTYLLFAGVSFAFGGFGWLLFGLRYNRMGFATFCGFIWFFLPDNLRVFLSEGNIPRMVTAIILPYFMYFLWEFIEHRKRFAIFPIILSTMMITLSHTMIGAMLGISAFLFLLVYFLYTKELLKSMQVLFAMLLSYALCGIWLIPALKGGLLGMDSSATSEVMASLSYTLSVSLNPFARLNGPADVYYFGLSIFLICILGFFIANKKSQPGFYTSIIVLLGTTTAAVPLLSKLPLNQLLWMMRFTTIIYGMFLLSLIEWKERRRYVTVVLAVIILIDCIPSFQFSRFYAPMESKLNTAIQEAKSITDQRIALFDISIFGSYPSYAICAEDKKIQYAYGWAWQGASTSSNIVLLNTALEQGYYNYLFDRCVEIGCDTAIVAKDRIAMLERPLSELEAAAANSGYFFYKETNDTYIFHRGTPETFGVDSKYQGICIGTSSVNLTLEYPSFEVGTYTNVEKYTFEDLSQYETIYLSGFFYNDKAAAEALVTRLGEAGVRVVIDMNRIPVDPVTQRMDFLGVYAQPIQFERSFPTLVYGNQIVKAGDFEDKYYQWNTVYLEKIQNVTGYCWFADRMLPFSGTNGDDNIVFMGFNLLFHAMQTEDFAVIPVLSDALHLDGNALPERDIIPISVTYQANKIIIDSPEVNINTTLAFQDNFSSDDGIENRNNFLYITKNHTEITLNYPYLKAGLIVTAFGICGTAILLYFVFRRKGVFYEKAEY